MLLFQYQNPAKSIYCLRHLDTRPRISMTLRHFLQILALRKSQRSRTSNFVRSFTSSGNGWTGISSLSQH